MNLTLGILVVLVIGTWLQLCSRPLASPIPDQYESPFCVNEELCLTVKKHYELYIDGMKVYNLSNSRVWQKADRATLRDTARVIAVKGTKSEDNEGGFLASSNYFVTDASWKCTNRYYDGWAGVNFDDSAWPPATVIGEHAVSPWGIIAGVSTKAKWIWTPKYTDDSDSDEVIFCRKTRDYCECIGTGQSCVTWCKRLMDGDYQSCKGCHVFATCSKGVLYDEQPCEGSGLYWDAKLQRCQNQSSTCKPCSTDETTGSTRPTTATAKPSTTITPTTSTTVITTPTHKITTHTTSTPSSTRTTTACTTGSTCITSCRGLVNGAYQSCKGCHVYVACYNEELTDELPCSPYEALFWDDNLKNCTYSSDTCQPCPKVETTKTSELKHTTTAIGVCPTKRSPITSCCRLGDESSCINKLFYFICLIISHE